MLWSTAEDEEALVYSFHRWSLPDDNHIIKEALFELLCILNISSSTFIVLSRMHTVKTTIYTRTVHACNSSQK